VRLWISGPRIFGIRPGISFALSELLPRPSPPRHSRQLRGSFIYIVQADNGLIKVGISGNPGARLMQLRTASAVPLKLEYIGALRCNGYAIEAATHRTLADYRQNGEWFRCPTDMAVAAISAAAYRLGEPIASIDPMLRTVATINDMSGPGLLPRIALEIIKGIAGAILSLVIIAYVFVIKVLIFGA
jgi:hypothetical protein